MLGKEHRQPEKEIYDYVIHYMLDYWLVSESRHTKPLLALARLAEQQPT